MEHGLVVCQMGTNRRSAESSYSCVCVGCEPGRQTSRDDRSQLRRLDYQGRRTVPVQPDVVAASKVLKAEGNDDVDHVINVCVYDGSVVEATIEKRTTSVSREAEIQSLRATHPIETLLKPVPGRLYERPSFPLMASSILSACFG